MAEGSMERRLAAILAIDVAGFHALWGPTRMAPWRLSRRTGR
jgi:hypothetical protein